jgi:hypothetical protein
MVTKRGRKRKNEMYFGPEEEEAVVRFLESRHIETIDLTSFKKTTINHSLGEEVIVDAFYIIPNENAYGNDSKFLTIDVPITASSKTNESIDIITDSNVKDVTIIVVNEFERNFVFNDVLSQPLSKMVESIIRKYKLYRKGYTFEELHGDTISFLMTKVHKFETGRGKKAYSYFGTIAKNYILGLLIKDEKYMKQTASYEDVADNLEGRSDLVYNIDSESFSTELFIKRLSDGIKTEMEDENLPPKKRLNENERKVGLALVEILENWETAFEAMNGGSKYNKNSVLETMRNYTNLSTKDIRLAMKRYKELYEILKHHGL